MPEVRDAVILAGGVGTRMLPASLYMPKETMPLVDTPIINHLIWEAAKAGVSRVHLVLSKRKYEILSEFINFGEIHDKGVRSDLPREALSLDYQGIEIVPHIQSNPGGVADAVSVVLGDINGPLLVILGDMLILDKHVGPIHSGAEEASSASLSMVSKFEETGLPCVGLFQVEMDQTCNYGVAILDGENVEGIVEKPEIGSAPSNYVLCGRYILPANTEEILRLFPIEEFGEMQSIFLLNHLIETSGLIAVKMGQMMMYDSGNPIAWLKSQIDHALRRDDIEFLIREWLENRLSE
tara:strand:+ start:152 stop:1036 length:885 start_codon:yes stop_codon:yes gene_type:complete